MSFKNHLTKAIGFAKGLGFAFVEGFVGIDAGDDVVADCEPLGEEGVKIFINGDTGKVKVTI